MGNPNDISVESVELSTQDGVAFIEQASPLTRLHYFDGKFLKADALAQEQAYHRTQVQLANVSGGWGVVHGLGVGLSGDQITVGGGLAITPAGHFVMAVGEVQASVAALLKLATAAPAPQGNAELGTCPDKAASTGVIETAALGLYEVTVGPVEGLCGNEAVYGSLCESACVSDSRRPYWREGLVLRLRPVTLQLPTSAKVPLSTTHLRNRVASAYFGLEPGSTPSALSGSGLASDVWCQPASLYGRDEVVIGLLVREAGSNRFIDAWSGRRERMEPQAKGYWQGRMAMRPWNVYLAQILQFQCQLAAVFDNSSVVITQPDSCDDIRAALEQTRKEIEALQQKYAASAAKIVEKLGLRTTKAEAQTLADELKVSHAELGHLADKLSGVEAGTGSLPTHRLLINRGFVQLPPAGYLPVQPGKTDLGEQLSRIFGEGVRLHLHAVRHDEIAHLLEEAQHMERISLTRGIDDPAQVEEVEVFVPDGQVFGIEEVLPGVWWQVELPLEALGAFDLGLSASLVDASTVPVPAPAAAPAPAPAAAAATAEAATGGQSTLTLLREAPAPASKKAKSKAAEAKAGLSINQAGASAAPLAAAVSESQAREQLLALMRQMAARPFRGLARTESRTDASQGFTLVATLDVQDLIEEMQRLVDEFPQLDPNGALQKFQSFSIYLAGDIGADPMGLAIGQATAVQAEMRLMGTALFSTGQLTVQFDRAAGPGQTERVVQLRVVSAIGDKAMQQTGSISLYREGSAAGEGQFVLDDVKHDPKTSPNIFEWSAQPRQAAMFIIDQPGVVAVAAKMMKQAAQGLSDTAAEAKAEAAKAAATDTAAAAEVAATRKQMLKMTGLSGMPAQTSTLGAAAMNALLGLAEQADDSAFLVRARQRLFPTADAATTSGVRAVLDWVMFRRARTHLCCPPPPQGVTQPAIEAFQVWHLQVPDAAALKGLQAALDGADAKQLATYKFQRVAVLRYRDANTQAEEPESQIEALWRAVKPGQQVVLGRYWEQEPGTGQGWQNHFRLRSMLDQIDEITTPPAKGSGSITRLETVTAPLYDGSLDGGMLVVTQTLASTRKALVITCDVDGEQHFLQKNEQRTDVVFVGNAPQGTALADFMSKLGGSIVVNEVTLATPRAAPDAGAATRMKAVIDACAARGYVPPGPQQQFIVALNEHDRKELQSIGIDPDAYDDVFFIDTEQISA